MSIVSRQFDSLYRSVDDVGNLYETKEKKDRVYGAGSRLLETKDARFSYDEEGNLVEKVEHNGDTWKYEFYGNGMMAKVMRPDKTEITFKYDALGRRIEKCSEGKATHFVWDGNTILHEYSTQNVADTLENLKSSQADTAIADNLVTWVFNDGFVPSAKITSEGHYSIISDYLGTPVEAYDEQGNKVWSAELDVYGRVKEFTGEKDFIPFRYQGQYEDVAIGLYYNRFRYYDPEQGNYTQVDPIGLAGNNPTLYGYVGNPNITVDPLGLSSFDPFEFGEITPFPRDIHFGQNRIAPNFSTIGSQANDSIVGRPILEVAKDISLGSINPNDFLISYTIDPATSKVVTLNNRGLAALAEGGKFPEHAIFVPYDKVPSHLVADIKNRPPSKTISITKNKDGSGLVKNVTNCLS
ncbi:RHS repeat domain-containing protein [Lysinibacillus sp. F5]|nr:RHS repeat-associated core domain-containing protein [Lysinibacillus sp. F5]KUF34088.1 hypothetical protein AK833_10470 [Lysinibacillus sp. F5]